MRTILAGIAAATIAAGVFAGPAPAVTVTVTGPEQTVYDWTTMRCDDFDIADGVAEAFRDATNRVQLISASGESRRMVGPDLNNLTRDCTTVFSSNHDPNPGHYDDVHWLAGTYTENVQHGFGTPFPVVRGKSFAFQCTTEGDDTWHIAGDVAGTPIVETWKRVSN